MTNGRAPQPLLAQPIPRVLLDNELHIVRANRDMCHSFGVIQDSLLGTRIDDWINVDPISLYRLRSRIRDGSVPWHVILRLRLSGLQVMVVSQILRPLRSRRGDYLLISLVGIHMSETGAKWQRLASCTHMAG